MLPADGDSSPAIGLNSVLLPHPDGPTIETNSPAPARMETPRRASTGSRPPKLLLTPSTSRSSVTIQDSGGTKPGPAGQPNAPPSAYLPRSLAGMRIPHFDSSS